MNSCVPSRVNILFLCLESRRFSALEQAGRPLLTDLS